MANGSSAQALLHIDWILVVSAAWLLVGAAGVAALRQRFGLTGTPVLIEVAGLGAEVTGQLCLQLSLTTVAAGTPALVTTSTCGAVSLTIAPRRDRPRRPRAGPATPRG